MDGTGVGRERLGKRRDVVPFVSLQVIRLYAGQIACLISSSNDVKVFIETARKETRPPEEQIIQTGHVWIVVSKKKRERNCC